MAPRHNQQVRERVMGATSRREAGGGATQGRSRRAPHTAGGGPPRGCRGRRVLLTRQVLPPNGQSRNQLNFTTQHLFTAASRMSPATKTTASLYIISLLFTLLHFSYALRIFPDAKQYKVMFTRIWLREIGSVVCESVLPMQCEKNVNV